MLVLIDIAFRFTKWLRQSVGSDMAAQQRSKVTRKLLRKSYALATCLPILPSKLQGNFGRFSPIFGQGRNRPVSPLIAAFWTKWGIATLT